MYESMNLKKFIIVQIKSRAVNLKMSKLQKESKNWKRDCKMSVVNWVMRRKLLKKVS